MEKFWTLVSSHCIEDVLFYIDCSIRITGVEKYILLIVSLIGFVFFDGVFAAAVVNYAIQSELNIFLLHAICIKVKNKMYRYMDVAIKVYKYIHKLASYSKLKHLHTLLLGFSCCPV